MSPKNGIIELENGLSYPRALVDKNNCMLIFVVGSFQWEMYAPAFADSFEKMGYNVLRMDYNEYHLKRNVFFANLLNRFQDRYLFGPMTIRFNKELVKLVREYKPDFVFLYRCYHIFSSTIREIKKETIVFTYNNDDPFSGIPSKYYSHLHRSNAKYADLNFVYRKKNIDDYAGVGVNNTKLLLPYYLTNQNFYIPSNKDIPLAFLGHYENDGRDKFILALKKAGLPIVVFGDEAWKSAPLYSSIKDVVFPAKRGKEYNEIMNRTQILLVFFSRINKDTYTRRCFEIPATKGFMLSERTDDMLLLFPEGKCAEFFSSEEELVSKCNYYLAHPEEINTIAESCYERIIEIGGSEHDRCVEIIEAYKKINNKKQ